MSTPAAPTAADDYAKNWQDDILGGWETIYRFMSYVIYHQLQSHVSNRTRRMALELGCGDGENTRRIARDFMRTIVVDHSPAFLDLAGARVDHQKKKGEVDWVCMDVEAYDPDPQWIRPDAIFMIHLLEHLDDPVAVLRKYASYLPPWGRLLIAVPNADSLHRQLGVQMGLLPCETALNAQDKQLGHKRVYTAALLQAHLQAAGLAYSAFKGSFLKPFSARQMNQLDAEVLAGLAKLGQEHRRISADFCVAAWPK